MSQESKKDGIRCNKSVSGIAVGEQTTSSSQSLSGSRCDCTRRVVTLCGFDQNQSSVWIFTDSSMSSLTTMQTTSGQFILTEINHGKYTVVSVHVTVYDPYLFCSRAARGLTLFNLDANDHGR
jgi:hypothetical protein